MVAEVVSELGNSEEWEGPWVRALEYFLVLLIVVAAVAVQLEQVEEESG